MTPREETIRDFLKAAGWEKAERRPLAGDASSRRYERLSLSGRPAVLTVNGQAEVVVQDAKSYQRLLARVEEADKLMALRRSVAEYRAGQFRDLDDALETLEARHVGTAKRHQVK